MANLTNFIRNNFDAIWTTGDVDAVMAQFTDDAVVTTVPALPGAPETFHGKDEIRGFVQMLIPNFHVASQNFREAGDHVWWFATVSSDSIRQMGVDALDTECEAVVRDDKIARFTPQFTPETLARLQAAATAAVGTSTAG